MRDQLRLGSATCWTVAWLLAVVAPIVYLTWPGTLSWWLAPLLVLPLLVLGERRRERDPSGVGGDGPWGPPGDHIGF